MYTLIITVHIIACLILVTAILFQSGRGGGLAGLFGGGASQTIFGARASTFLTRVTTVAAISFLLTCISLTILSGRRGKSLLEGTKEITTEEFKAEPKPLAGLEEVKPEELTSEEVTEEKPQATEPKPQIPQE